MKIRSLFLFSLTFLLFQGGFAQIKSGPMLGYNTMKEVAIWLQMEKEATIRLSYFPVDEKEKVQEQIAQIGKESSYTGILIAENLEPGTQYSYSIFIDGNKESSSNGTFKTQELWQHRTDPPNFKFTTGSCAYTNEEKYDRPGEPYGKGNEIFSALAKENQGLMLWLGDNIYLREPDWTSMSGINHRYTHFKSLPEIQSFWKNTHHYAIWDDHDYGPNDGDRSFINKDLTLSAFKNFWANPGYGINQKPGISTSFSFLDVDFFLMDNRYNRSPNERKTGKKQILGDEQIEWLIESLISSQASFKIVAIGGQFISPAAVHENHATFAEERQKILDLLEKENIKNVIFLSGDRHKTELSKLTLPNGNDVYDYTCSPLTSTSYNTIDEGNTLRVEGTHFPFQNYGVLNFSGSIEERELIIQTKDSKGKLVWERTIKKQK